MSLTKYQPPTALVLGLMGVVLAVTAYLVFRPSATPLAMFPGISICIFAGGLPTSRGRWFVMWGIVLILLVLVGVRYAWGMSSSAFDPQASGLLLEGSILMIFAGVLYGVSVFMLRDFGGLSPERKKRGAEAMPPSVLLSTSVVLGVAGIFTYLWVCGVSFPYFCAAIPIALCVWSRRFWHVVVVTSIFFLVPINLAVEAGRAGVERTFPHYQEPGRFDPVLVNVFSGAVIGFIVLKDVIKQRFRDSTAFTSLPVQEK